MATKHKPQVVSLSIEELAQGIQEAAKRLLDVRSRIYYTATPFGETEDEVMCPGLGKANGVLLYVNDLANGMARDLADIQNRAAAIERWAADPKTDGQAIV